MLPIDAVEAFLDTRGLGSGPAQAARIGDGASNLTYLVERDGARVVLRHALGERLKATMPESAETTVVHGDYRLGNVLVAREAPARVAAILDWEMATLGDPLADLGYLAATWSEAMCDEHPLLLGPVTAGEGFATREELVARYAEQTGRDVSALPWYQAFALWKASVFCEAIYGRYLKGERADAWAGALCDGVPRLLDVAEATL